MTNKEDIQHVHLSPNVDVLKYVYELTKNEKTEASRRFWRYYLLKCIYG